MTKMIAIQYLCEKWNGKIWDLLTCTTTLSNKLYNLLQYIDKNDIKCTQLFTGYQHNNIQWHHSVEV